MNRTQDKDSVLGEFVKKIVTASVGTLFLTEENFRSLVKEIKLPKELIGGFLGSANRTRKEFMKNFSEELIDQILSRMDIKELIQELLADNEIRVKLDLKFHPRTRGSRQKKS